MSKRFKNKIIIVTGCSSGIGAACVDRLLTEGGTVIGADLQEPKKAQAISAFISCDVSDEKSIARLVDTVVDTHGRVDILVHSAGTAGSESVRIHELSFETWDMILAVNARGAFAMMKAVIPHMLRTGGGNIVNIASIGSFRATPRAAAYLSSKGAMMMLTRAAAVEYAQDNIRVNAVCPSTTNTDILNGIDPENLENLVARHPQNRLGEPQEVAALVAFLASDEAPHMTGGAHLIDGGRSAS